jgi:hypothetical protein
MSDLNVLLLNCFSSYFLGRLKHIMGRAFLFHVIAVHVLSRTSSSRDYQVDDGQDFASALGTC